ncbi:hypothetical protein AMTRI_Chr03g49300 [Amborella trichopoda]
MWSRCGDVAQCGPDDVEGSKRASKRPKRIWMEVVRRDIVFLLLKNTPNINASLNSTKHQFSSTTRSGAWYWQTNMNNVKSNKFAHKESVHDLSFSRTDLKFFSCSDDGTVKTCHSWDVKSVDWHPTKSLLVSGSDARIMCIHGHKNWVLCVKWNQNSNWVLTSLKDQIIKELESYCGHHEDVTALVWHPFHEEYFVSGSYDGSIFHWPFGHETPQAEVNNARENSVWDLAWHPIFYILCSGSIDHTTRFWCRNRLGDTSREKHVAGYNQGPGDAVGLAYPLSSNFPLPKASAGLGAFPSRLTRNEGTIPGVGVTMPLSIPIPDSSEQGEQRPPLQVLMPMAQPPLPLVPHPFLLESTQYNQIPQEVRAPQMVSLPLPTPLSPIPHPSHLAMPQHMHMPRPLSHLVCCILCHYLHFLCPLLSYQCYLHSLLPCLWVQWQIPYPSLHCTLTIYFLGSTHYQPMYAMQVQSPMNVIRGGSVTGGNVQPPLSGFANGVIGVEGPASTSGVVTYAIRGMCNRSPGDSESPTADNVGINE